MALKNHGFQEAEQTLSLMQPYYLTFIRLLWLWSSVHHGFS